MVLAVVINLSLVLHLERLTFSFIVLKGLNHTNILDNKYVLYAKSGPFDKLFKYAFT